LSISPDDPAPYRAVQESPAFRLLMEHEIYGVAHDAQMPASLTRSQILQAIGGAGARGGARLNDIGPWLDLATLYMPMPGHEVPRAVRDGIEALLPPIAKAMEAGRLFRALTRSYAMLLDLFDRLDFAAAFCTGGGRVLICNRRFREMTAERDALWRDGDALVAPRPADTHRLRRLIADALSGAAVGIATLPRRSGALPLVLRAIAVDEAQVARDPVTLLVAIDPEAGSRVSADGLAALGLLSEAELDVCRHLVRGLSLAEVAAQRDTSLETARTQSKAVQAKLACRNRLDLLRLALVTRPPVDPSIPRKGDATD
jgi:DNA-binding CsgD family transcriptional regulator